MKEIFIERSESLLRIAIKENNELVESIVEEKKSGPIIGEIYKGKIKNIIQGTNSIFVDLGLDKEGYMYYSDELKSKDLKKGDEILVEVIKEPIGNKGAKITHKVSIPGKYVVLDCYSSGIKFSKRINDDLKKEEILNNIAPLEDVCITIRTEGANIALEKLKAEIDKFYEIFKNLDSKMKYSLGTQKLYGDDAILTKILTNNIGNETVN